MDIDYERTFNTDFPSINPIIQSQHRIENRKSKSHYYSLHSTQYYRNHENTHRPLSLPSPPSRSRCPKAGCSPRHAWPARKPGRHLFHRLLRMPLRVYRAAKRTSRLRGKCPGLLYPLRSRYRSKYSNGVTPGCQSASTYL